MDSGVRRFKEGVGSGRDTTDRRVQQGLRKKKERNQARLKARRSAMTTMDTPTAAFEQLRAHTLALLQQGPQQVEPIELITAIQQSLCYPDRDVAEGAVHDFFGTPQGPDLLRWIASLISAGPKSPLFGLALACVTEISFDSRNVAYVEVLCRAGVHEAGLSWLTADRGLPGEIRQDIFAMLGNTARNNEHARLMILQSPGTIKALTQNLLNGVEHLDWPIISLTLYMMYVLCENSHGGITPPLSHFEPTLSALTTVMKLVMEVSPSELLVEQYDSALGILSFFEAIALNTNLSEQASEDTQLLVQQRNGVLLMAQTPEVQHFLAYALQSKNRQLAKKAASTISFTASAGVDAIQPLLEANILPLLVNLLNQIRTEPYAVRHIIRFIFLLTTYKGAYIERLLQSEALATVCGLLKGDRGRVLDQQQMTYAIYALHRVCTLEAEPLKLKALYTELCNEHFLGAALAQALRRCVQSGDVELTEDVIDSLTSLLCYCPKIVMQQMEEQDAINLLSRIQHVVNTQSTLYKKAVALEQTYFEAYS